MPPTGDWTSQGLWPWGVIGFTIITLIIVVLRRLPLVSFGRLSERGARGRLIERDARARMLARGAAIHALADASASIRPAAPLAARATHRPLTARTPAPGLPGRAPVRAESARRLPALARTMQG